MWSKDLEAHQRIIDLIREGEGDIARQYLNKAMERFARRRLPTGRNAEIKGGKVGVCVDVPKRSSSAQIYA